MTNLQVPDEPSQYFEKLAHESGRDTGDFMLDALASYLEEIEDVHLVSERLNNPQPTLSLDEVKRNPGLDC